MFSQTPYLFREVFDTSSPHEELFHELYGTPYRNMLYNTPRYHVNVFRPRYQTRVSSSKQFDSKSDSKFQVMLNVKHFRPDEIDVKTVDDFVVVHGKHEEHADEHGFVSREFTRRYQIPDDVEPEKVSSSLSKDGVLTIEAPPKMIEPPPKNERIVPIAIQQHAAVEEAQKFHEQHEETSENK